MKIVWASFFWYMTCALILVSSTSRFLLLEKNSDTSSLIGYVTFAAGMIMGIVYLITILKYYKEKILKTHVLLIIYVYINASVLTLVMISVSEDIFKSMFPVLFSFSLILFLFSFFSEISFRELGNEIFLKESKDE